jgi:hypothetical protein
MSSRALLLLAAALVAACGGSSSSPSAGSPSGSPGGGGSGLETFKGTTRSSDSGVCSADPSPHTFDTGEGTVGVTLVESTGSLPVNVQLCHPAADNHEVDCTIPPFVRVEVGMTVRATLKGGRSQTLTVYPSGCGVDQAPTPPISYTVTVTHPR